MKYSQWKINGYNRQIVEQLCKSGVPYLPATILASRDLLSADAAIGFLNENSDCYGDPITMPDMEKAVDRIRTVSYTHLDL